MESLKQINRKPKNNIGGSSSCVKHLQVELRMLLSN